MSLMLLRSYAVGCFAWVEVENEAICSGRTTDTHAAATIFALLDLTRPIELSNLPWISWREGCSLDGVEWLTA